MIHDLHDLVLIPPSRILHAFNLSAHNDDLSSWDEFTTTVSRTQVLWYSSRSHVTIESLCHARDELLSLLRAPRAGWTRRQNKVAIEVDDESVLGRGEECSTFGSDTKNVWAGFLDQFLDMASVNDWYVKAAPFVYADHVTNSLGSDCKHSRVVRDEDDTPCR